MASSGSEFYQPGDLVYHEEPFLTVIRSDLWGKMCAHCLKKDLELKTCTQCKVMKYCGINCQKEAWENHKLECLRLQYFKESEHETLVHMVGNIILKIKGRNWKTVRKQILGRYVSFDELKSESNPRNKKGLFMLYKSIENPLKEYIGEDNFSNRNKGMEVLGKVVNNQAGCSGNYFCPEVASFFFGISNFDHSCVPNSIISYDEKTFSIRAIKEINIRSEKVTITYCPMLTVLQALVKCNSIATSVFKDCCCSDCSQPYGDSTLTKVLDSPKASAVIAVSEDVIELVALCERLNYRNSVVTRTKLKELLENQNGVLGNTNILRMRTLALLGLYYPGPPEEVMQYLMELSKCMMEAWGENYQELITVNMKMLLVSLEQNDQNMINACKDELYRLSKICYGDGTVKEKEVLDSIQKKIDNPLASI